MRIVERFRELVFGSVSEVFRRALVGTPGNGAVNENGSNLSGGDVTSWTESDYPQNTASLTERFRQLKVEGVVVRDPLTTCSSPAMAVPKGTGSA